MNFLNLLTSSTNLFNFNLNSTNPSPLPLHSSLTTSKTLNNEPLIPPPANSALSSNEPVPSTPPADSNGQPQLNKNDQVDMFTQQQQLINQYMHLNIQLLSKKLETLQHEKQPKNQEREEKEEKTEPQGGKKKIKKINNCGHPDREHYAKGMCNNCYHKYGRTKKPWNCPHNKLYANGMCQNCYINSYNRKRREGKVDEGEKADRKEEEEPVKVEEEPLDQ